MYWSNMTHREWYNLNRDLLTLDQRFVFEELLEKLEDLEELIKMKDSIFYNFEEDND